MASCIFNFESGKESAYENSNHRHRHAGQQICGNDRIRKSHWYGLSANTRFREQYCELLRPALEKGITVYQSADALFEAVDGGSLKIDAVIITTPHISHEQIALEAFKRGLHVLCYKPAGVCSAQARRMNDTAQASGCIYGMIFNQRALAVNQKIHEIMQSGRYGSLRRLIWTVTDWYRPEKYYQSGSWLATWKGEGGGGC